MRREGQCKGLRFFLNSLLAGFEVAPVSWNVDVDVDVDVQVEEAGADQ